MREEVRGQAKVENPERKYGQEEEAGWGRGEF
jgi:hypothetical protein